MDEQMNVISNPLRGKTYEFVSSRFMNWRAFFDSRIYTTIEVAQDRLILSKKPKRMNTVPAIFLEDITGIEITMKFGGYYLIWTAFALFCLFVTLEIYYLAFVALFLWAGMNRKITITQRNGVNVIVYSRNKDNAAAFKEDMKTIVTIR